MLEGGIVGRVSRIVSDETTTSTTETESNDNMNPSTSSSSSSSSTNSNKNATSSSNEKREEGKPKLPAERKVTTKTTIAQQRSDNDNRRKLDKKNPKKGTVWTIQG